MSAAQNPPRPFYASAAAYIPSLYVPNPSEDFAGVLGTDQRLQFSAPRPSACHCQIDSQLFSHHAGKPLVGRLITKYSFVHCTPLPTR